MKLGTLVLPLLAVLTTGCGVMKQGLYSDYSAAPLDDSALDGYNKLTRALQSPGPDQQPLVRKACFAPKIDDAKLGSDCAAERNQAISALVFASEQLCIEHRRTIYGNDAAWNVGLGTMTNIFAGAASVAAVTRTKSILAALALFSNSERSLVNETIYKTMLVTAVDKKIVEGRDAQMVDIYASMRKDINTYGMADALRSVTTLHASCSFMTGLQKALEEGTQPTATQKLTRLKMNLESIKLEINALGTTAADTAQRTELEARYKAVSASIQKLETE